MTGAPHKSQNFTGAMNRVPHLLQVDSCGIRVPQNSQNLKPGSTGLLHAGQVRFSPGGVAGFTIERNFNFYVLKTGGLSYRRFPDPAKREPVEEGCCQSFFIWATAVAARTRAACIHESCTTLPFSM